MSAKPPILVQRKGNHLVGIDEWSSEQLEAYPEGVTLNCKLTRSTATGDDPERAWLRFWWAGINLLHNNIEDPKREFPTPDHLKRRIMEDLGFYSVIQRIDGIKKDADSISLDKMDQTDRDYLLELARTHCLSEWGWDPWQTWADEQDLKKQRGGR